MIFRQRIPESEAHQVTAVEQAVAATGYSAATPSPGEDWAVEWDRAGLVLHLGGRTGDYLHRNGDAWTITDAATFTQRWEPVTEDLRTSPLRGDQT